MNQKERKEIKEDIIELRDKLSKTIGGLEAVLD